MAEKKSRALNCISDYWLIRLIDSDEELEGFKQMVESFKDYAPEFTGPISPQKSVEMVLSVVDNATVEKDGGAFVSHYGNKQWL
jgi:hypothetical protein